jgi:hypothetical protein
MVDYPTAEEIAAAIAELPAQAAAEAELNAHIAAIRDAKDAEYEALDNDYEGVVI